jgi:putative cardiolipin synthase
LLRAFADRGLGDPVRIFLSLLIAAITPAHAEQIKVLQRGDQSLSAFYQAIAGAQHTIDLATFLIEPCQAAPKLLLDALVKKAKQGVKVRIVLEAFTFKEPHKSGLPAWLNKEGKQRPNDEVSNIEVRRYGGSTMLGGDRSRSHIKSLVIDGADANGFYIVGGRNLTDDYFGLSQKLNYLDQDLLVRGPSAKQAEASFNELWKTSAKAAIVGDGRAYYASCLRAAGRDQAVAQFIQSQSAAILNARPGHNCSSVQYTMDHPEFLNSCGRNDGEPGSEFLSGECFTKKRTTQMVLAFMKGTQQKLAMNNQYYFPWLRVRDMFDFLRDKKKRSIEVISNATGDIEDMPTHNAAFTCYIQSRGYQTFKGTQKVSLLTSRGALRDSWELSPGGAEWRIHTKTAIRDERDVLVSSWNIDPRSYQTNLESGAVITNCPSLAQDLNIQYEQLRETAKADKECRPCKAEFLPSNLSDTVWCGGTPVFY